MRIFFAFALAAFMSATAAAQTPFEQLSRDAALERFETTAEEGMEAFTLIYTRVDPELAELIGSAEWDEVDREAAACVYDTYAEAGELELLGASLEAGKETAQQVRDDESITMIAMMTGEADRSLLTPDLPEDQFDRSVEVSTQCGVLEANARRYSNPELMQRLMTLMETAQ